MKKILFAVSAVALALSAGSAMAADLPSRKEAPVYVPPPPPPMWTGFYVGLNAGGAFGSGSVDAIGGPIYANPGFGPVAGPLLASGLGAVTNASLSGSNGGFVGGGQIGYNWQFNAFVVGLEADIQGFAGSNRTASAVSGVPVTFGGVPVDNFVGTTSVNRSLDYLGTVRGRVGYLFTPTLLIYGTGGLAYGGVNLNSTFFGTDTLLGGLGAASPAFGGSSHSDTRVGWTAGGGVEWMFAPNWSAKLEYLYFDLGTATTPVSVSTQVATGPIAGLGPLLSAAQQVSSRFNGNIVRAGVNYHFNWGAPAPVVAKY
ncbi:MAG TPA: outer membrane beta-barrel protein [Methylocystis sp.]